MSSRTLILSMAVLAADWCGAQTQTLGYRLANLHLDIAEYSDFNAPKSGAGQSQEQPIARWPPWPVWNHETEGQAPAEKAVGQSADVGLRTSRIVLVGGLALGVGFGVAEAHRHLWWEDRHPTSRFHDNWRYARWSDKFGHYYSSSLLARYYSSSLDWAGLPEPQARAWGAGLAWGSMLYYEILDGFGPTWGFSAGDLFFNTLGVGVTYAQWQIPELAPYRLKVSYWPSPQDEIVTADYTGLTWWVTANLHSALASSGGQSLPKWLNVGVGYGARAPDERGFLTRSVAYVGLDLELEALPIDHPVWDAVVKWLKYFHIPGPAVRISPDPAFVVIAH